MFICKICTLQSILGISHTYYSPFHSPKFVFVLSAVNATTFDLKLFSFITLQ